MSSKREKTSVKGVFRRSGNYEVTWRDRNGISKSQTVPTFEQARQLKGKVEFEKGLAPNQMSNRTKFEDLAREWVAGYVGKRTLVTDKTRNDYLRQLENHIFPVIGHMTLSDITPNSLGRIVSGLLTGKGAAGRKLVPDTVRRVLVPVRRVFKYAVNEGLLMVDPSAAVEVPPQRRSTAKTRVLTPDELALMLAEIPEEHKLLIETIAVTGMRWSEAAGLGPEHISERENEIQVRRTGARGELHPTKTEQSCREIKISRDLWLRLRERAEEAKHAALLFTRLDGRMLADNHMRRQVLKPAAIRAGIGEISGFHVLRHTAGSQLYANGANMSQVQAFLGHASPSFTHNTYVHLLGDERQPVLEIPKLEGPSSAREVDGQ